MLHAHYMSKNVRGKDHTARCVYNVWMTKEQRDALFRDAPIQHRKVVLGWYDKTKREVCLRRASAAEMGFFDSFSLNEVSPNVRTFGQTKGMVYGVFTTNRVKGGALSVDFPFLFAMREAEGVRVVNVKGIPHLVWRLPTFDQVEAPRMKHENRENLFNPHDNPNSDVRYVTVKQYVEAQASQSASKPVNDPGPRIGWGNPNKTRPVAPAVEQPKANGDDTTHLRTLIAHTNLLAAKLGAKLAVEGGKLRAKIVTEVDL